MDSVDSERGSVYTPTFVIEARCKNNSKCVEVCPGDVMRVDLTTNKAYNSEPDMCWDCLSCVKACPERAIEIRPYADISPMGSQISIRRDEQGNTITWDLKYRNGLNKNFQLPIRTTAWDSIPSPVSSENDTGELENQELCNESDGSSEDDLLSVSKCSGKAMGNH